MISKIFVVLALCAVLAAAAPTPAQQWAEWKTTYGKLYASQGEEAKRFAIFTENLEVIAQQNNVSKTATFGANKFADLSRDEFRQYYLSAPINPDLLEVPRTRMEPSTAPASFSWLDHSPPVVTPVKNQGQCGSCWAFSAVSNVESLWALAGNTLVSLSEQNLVDCDHECMQYDGEKSCDAGCNGGLQPNAFHYMMSVGGIDTEASYPYSAVDGQCQFNAKNIGASIKNWTMITNDESELPGILVKNGPLSIAADAAEWQFYIGGVFDLPCGKSLDHGIVIEGYGEAKDIIYHGPYWLIRNSWGSDWGEKGYLRIKRGDDKCGLANFVSTSII